MGLIPNLSYCPTVDGIAVDNRFNLENSISVFINEDLLVRVLDSIESDLIKIKVLCLLRLIRRRFEIYRNGADASKRGEKWVNLKTFYCRKHFGTRDWPEVVSLAVSCGAIEVDNTYKTGDFARSYRLTELNNENPEKFYVKYTNRIIKNENKNILKKSERIVCEGSKEEDQAFRISEDTCYFERSLAENLSKVSLCAKPYDISMKYHLDTYFWENFANLLQIQANEIFLSTDKKTGRKFHNLTCISKDARNGLLLDSSPCSELDYSAFHPHLALRLYNKDCDEKIRYTEMLSRGFYEEMAAMIGYNLTSDNKQSFKSRCMTEIFYDKEKKHYDLFHTFFNRFPILGRKILDEKSENHADFAIKIQNLEANYIFDELFIHFFDQNLLTIPLHDAVICKKIDSPKIYAIMTETFKKSFGVECPVKIKDLTFQ